MRKWNRGLIAVSLCVILAAGSGLPARAADSEAAAREMSEQGEIVSPVQTGEEQELAEEQNALWQEESSQQTEGELKDIGEEKIPLADAVAQGGGFLGALGIGIGLMALFMITAVVIVSVKNKASVSKEKESHSSLES